MTDKIETYLGPLLVDPSKLRREAVRRRKNFDEKKISPEVIPEHEAEGWQVLRPVKGATKIRREKEIDVRLENRFWLLLFKMGYPVERAARLIYLNRTCFNGLYRVNKQGVFNVPIGSKALVEFPRGYLEAVRDALWHVALRVSDFERVIDEAGDGDFVYADPPYSVMHNTNNFIKYNANLFSWDDQVRLATAGKRAAKRGALVMVSNADHACIRALYRDFGEHHRIERSSVLASSSEHRRKTTELLVTSYKA